MTEALKTLVAIDAGVSRETVQAAFPPGGSVEVVGLVEGIDDAWNTLQSTPTDLLVVAVAGYSDRVLYLIDGAVKERPERPVIVLAQQGSANGFVQRAFEAGADDFITLPESPERVVFALQKAIARKRGAQIASGVALAKLICILGPKGGTGKTLTAVNLSAALAELGQRVTVVDLDLQFGDLGLALGLAPDRTIFDLVKAGGTLDAEKLDAYLMSHPSGAKALLAPTRPDQAGAVTVEFLRGVYSTMRSSCDVVVVDTPPGFTPEVIASIDSSTHVCMVGMLDALSLKNTKIGLETLGLMAYDPNQVSVVLNRSDTRVGISREDVTSILGRTPDVFVPSNRDIPRAVNEGLPIVTVDPKSEASRAFRALAGLYVDGEEQVARADRPSRFRLMRRR